MLSSMVDGDSRTLKILSSVQTIWHSTSQILRNKHPHCVIISAQLFIHKHLFLRDYWTSVHNWFYVERKHPINNEKQGWGNASRKLTYFLKYCCSFYIHPAVQNTSLPAPDINFLLFFLKPVSRLLYVNKSENHPGRDGCVLYLCHFLLIFCKTGLKLSVRFRREKRIFKKRKERKGATIFRKLLPF